VRSDRLAPENHSTVLEDGGDAMQTKGLRQSLLWVAPSPGLERTRDRGAFSRHRDGAARSLVVFRSVTYFDSHRRTT
jgi:hypothetical protein